MNKTANRTFSVLFYIDADIVPLGLYRQHLCNSRFTTLVSFIFVSYNVLLCKISQKVLNTQ
jgi:hypothetical protein